MYALSQHQSGCKVVGYLKQDANSCVWHLGLLGLSESICLPFLSRTVSDCPSVITSSCGYIASIAAQVYQVPCSLKKRGRLKHWSVRHYQYPSQVVCHLHATSNNSSFNALAGPKKKKKSHRSPDERVECITKEDENVRTLFGMIYDNIRTRGRA